MSRDLLKEAIADAKAVKETAIANAKAYLEEAFTPQLRSMLAAKLEEMDEDEVSETVSELRENGWIASPLDVSKVLAKMAFCKELLKNKQDDRSFYFVKEALLAE